VAQPVDISVGGGDGSHVLGGRSGRDLCDDDDLYGHDRRLV
jgi:hypothetical protein